MKVSVVPMKVGVSVPGVRVRPLSAAVLARVMCLTNEGYGLGYEARNYTVMKEVKSTTRLALG